MASLFVLCVSQGDGHFETQLPGSVEYRRHGYNVENYVPKSIPKIWESVKKRGIRLYAFTIEGARGLVRVIKEGAQVPYTIGGLSTPTNVCRTPK